MKKKSNLEILRNGILIASIYTLILLIGFFLYPIIENYAFISKDTVDIDNYIVNIFPEIPEVYFEGITNVYLQENKTTYHEREFGDNAGYYTPITREIFIFTEDGLYIKGVLLHEIGHHVYYSMLNQSQRNEWKKIYEEAWNLPQEEYCFISGSNETCKEYRFNERFISKYAETEPGEDFAESFENFMNYRYKYMECYLKECKFSGFRYLTEARRKFMIENIYMIYEQEEFESVKESILWEN